MNAVNQPYDTTVGGLKVHVTDGGCFRWGVMHNGTELTLTRVPGAASMNGQLCADLAKALKVLQLWCGSIVLLKGDFSEEEKKDIAEVVKNHFNCHLVGWHVPGTGKNGRKSRFKVLIGHVAGCYKVGAVVTKPDKHGFYRS